MSETTKAPEAPAQKKVKIRMVRDAMVDGTIRTPGQVVEVTEDTAKKLCDKGAPGYHPFYGYMPEMAGLYPGPVNPLERRKLVKAERIA